MKSTFITLAFAAFMVLLAGCSNKSADKQDSIDDLLLHFQQDGLKVEPPVKRSAVDKKFYDDSMKLAKLIKNRKSKLIEFRTIHVQGIKVKIRRYKDDDSAIYAYKNLMALEENTRQNYLKENRTYYKQDFLLNPPYVLSIKHFRVIVKNDRLNAIPLDLSEKAIKKIIKSFNCFE
ncbi:hypothetical protein P0136_06605 [Lentisphaerota bacterium ZTH]|nr:hypothetical protein JYG24_02285 [Lentisphaerota bacterium]WET07660.1 hypothetical protein P0136_06605 [Lentisphaerota bacterium ZTH]